MSSATNRLRSLVVLHADTGERRSLEILRIGPREVELRWPLHGAVRFLVREGTSVQRSAWRLSPLALAMLHRELKIIDLDPIFETETELQKAFA